MGRFYFHLKQEGHLVTDQEGLEFPSLSEAKQEVLQVARES